MHVESHTLKPDPNFGVFNASASMFVLPSLPFELTALVPVTSPETLHAHLDKHHLAYVTAANALLEPMAKRFESAIEVIQFARETGAESLEEQASQALNHGFFWACQQAGGLTRPQGGLEVALNGAFGDFDGFIAAAVAAGKLRVGSGWLWLVGQADGAVSLVLTKDAETLLDDGVRTPLLVCDLWEHAYYLDHQSDRAAWVTGFFSQLADWSLAGCRHEDLLAGATLDQSESD